jgi:hypothetical protein
MYLRVKRLPLAFLTVLDGDQEFNSDNQMAVALIGDLHGGDLSMAS